MGKDESPAEQPATSGKGHAADQDEHTRQPLWRRPVVWLGSVATAVVIGVLIGVLTPLVQRVVPSPTSAPAKSSGDAVNQPVQIQSAGYLPGFNEVFAFPTALSRPQMLTATRGVAQHQFAQNLKYVAALGGAPTHLQLIQVVLHSAVQQVATVREIQVVKQCTAPFTGTELWNPAESAIDNISIGFNLDSDTSDAQFVNAGNQFYGNYFAKKSIQLAPGESDTLSIFILTTRQFCRFSFRLYVDYGTHQRVETIDNEGRPFTASAGLPFSRFKVIYAGGDATANGSYVREDPKTYQG
jgi:hypothetical protein